MSRWAKTRRGLAAGVLGLLLGLPALAQTPFVADEEKFGRIPDDFTLRYCVDPRDPAWEVDQAIAEAIAAALLVEPAPFVVEDVATRESIDNLYRHLLADCSLYFGFKLLPGVYPDWLGVTRPYYQVGYVLAVQDPAVTRLGDLPKSAAIGPTLATAADFALVAYLNALPERERWPRYPQMSDEAALDELLAGHLGGALVWGPSFDRLARTNPAYASLKLVPLDPVSVPDIPVGAVLLSNDTFLRSTIDEAIAALVADGTIATILADRHFPARLPQ